MKKKSMLVCMLLCMLVSMQNIVAANSNYIANTVTKYDTDKPTEWRKGSSNVGFTTVSSADKAIEVTYTIKEGTTDEELVICFDYIFNSWILRQLEPSPGENITVKINIVNNSSKKFTYKKDSLLVSTADISDYKSQGSHQADGSPYDPYMYDTLAFDQQKIPLNLTCHRVANSAIVALYGKSNSTQITIDDMITLYDTLTTKGYTGDHALTQYYLDYYNTVYGTSATNLDQLSLEAIADIYTGADVSIYQSCRNSTQLNQLYQRLITYDLTYPVDNADYGATTLDYWAIFFEVEPELIQAGYNYFYNEGFGISFNSVLSPGSDTITNSHSIGSYMRKEVSYKQANTVMNTIVLEPEGGYASLDDIVLRLNSNNGNGLRSYISNFKSSILLTSLNTAVETGNVTLRTVETQTMELISDKVTKFNLYRSSEENGKEYYGKEDTWVTDQEDAKEFTTIDGILIIDNLEYGNYGFTQMTAPEGYDLASEDLTFILSEDTPDLELDFKNSKIPDTPPIIETGSVTLHNIDSQTMELISDKGTAFNLYRSNEQNDKEYYGKNGTWVIDQKEAKLFTTTNGILTINDLEYGNYGLIETTAPEGYDLANNDLTFTLSEDTSDVSLDFKNTKTPDTPLPPIIPIIETGSVTLHDIDSQTMELISDKGTAFNLYRSSEQNGKEYYGKDGTWVIDPKEAKLFTTTNGILIIKDLVYGNYGFTQITAPQGYELSSKDLTFTIDKNTSDISLDFRNTKKITIPDLPNTPDSPVIPSKIPENPTTIPPTAMPVVKTSDTTPIIIWGIFSGFAAIMSIKMMRNKRYTGSNK